MQNGITQVVANISQEEINSAILSFGKRIEACNKAGGQAFEHLLK